MCYLIFTSNLGKHVSAKSWVTQKTHRTEGVCYAAKLLQKKQNPAAMIFDIILILCVCVLAYTHMHTRRLVRAHVHT